MRENARRSLRLRRSRGVVGLVVAALALAIAAPAAHADAPGPTDYRTEIVGIDPAIDVISLEMIGGDSFIRMTVEPGHDVIVLGYRGEDYLSFDGDGIVRENRRSPATWLNQERYGTEDLPSFADHEAAPQWVEVSTGGVWSWHDHRTHWMNEAKPPGAEPGDQVLEASVPMLVDGQAVTVTVASWLLEPPSKLPAIGGVAFGLIAGLMTVVGGWASRRAPQSAVVVITGAVTLAFGAIAFTSVPGETTPDTLLWLLPATAVASGLLLLLIHGRVSTTVYPDGLLVAAGAVLMLWAVRRIDALVRSLIPSDAPATIDRLAVAAALVLGAAIALRGIIGLVRPRRIDQGSDGA